MIPEMNAYWSHRNRNLVRRIAFRASLAFALASAARPDIPAGFGKDSTVRVCGRCHSPERAVSSHQTRGEWEDTVSKMVKLGAQATDEEFDEIIIYLTAHFGPEKPGPLNINKANSVDLQTTLLLRRSQANAVVQYRLANGDFKSIEDLHNVPGLDFAKIESKKSRLMF